ncbi:LytTR family DNA-binding domain-containing protein [Actimicrobium antarcticum]|uniref:LytTR family DNA-binding domain-containing protein n=1 Tax=Actimicrobium antarcticum TaxID=1051899 RepID=A0ABP7SV92_9BURK
MPDRLPVRLFLVDDEALARSRLRDVLSDIALECPHEIVGEADQAQAAIDGIVLLAPDIVLLDVQMPGMSGIALADHLGRTLSRPPSVIFISAYDDYAVKAFEVRALDYLMKPIRAGRLAEAIRRVVALRQNEVGPIVTQGAARQHFPVQERGRLLLVPVADVIYLKAEAKYVTLRTSTREHLIEESLLSIEEELAAQFVRVHRNALVARNAIAGVERIRDVEGDSDTVTWQVILRGVTDRLPISRRQWATIKALVK